MFAYVASRHDLGTAAPCPYKVKSKGRVSDLKVLFMSGYTADIITRRGVLDENVDFIQKPFSLKSLAAKVNVILHPTCH